MDTKLSTLFGFHQFYMNWFACVFSEPLCHTRGFLLSQQSRQSTALSAQKYSSCYLFMFTLNHPFHQSLTSDISVYYFCTFVI